MARRTDETLERFAREFRRELGLEYQLRIDLMTVIHKLKSHDRSFNYRRVPDEQMPDEQAQWNSFDRIISLRESVFVGMNAQQPFARGVVAEEIAHYRLGHHGIRNRSVTKKGHELSAPQVLREESEAQRLAVRFLIPEYLVDPSWTAEIIADKFGVSLKMATIRIEEIRSSERQRTGQSRVLPSVVVDFLREAQRRGLRVNTPLDE